MHLSEIIKDRILEEGPLSFHDFMELSLYHPAHGYYTSGGDKIGEAGDFYTSPCLTTLFGEMLAKQLEEMWLVLGRQPFTIVEYGAGTGLLCRDILHALKANEKLYRHLDYCIIERSGIMREKEKAILGNMNLSDKVRWFDSIGDLPPIRGCILSNELIDNLSVHRVIMEENLMEVFVDYKKGFVETLRPAEEVLKDYFGRLQVALPKGFKTEINLQAIEWIQTLSKNLERGFVLTIDYGHPSSVLYSHGRNGGTLVCYYRHRATHCPYDHVGEQDITSYVNFSALYLWGQNNGLDYCGYTTQTFFLQGLGLAAHLREMEGKGKRDSPAERAKMLLVRTFLMDMGARFKVLIQRRGINSPLLSGLKFTQRLI